MHGPKRKSRPLTALLLALYLSSPILTVFPGPAIAQQPGPPNQGLGTTPASPGTVTNVAGWNPPNLVCTTPSGQPLSKVSSWSKSLIVPSLLMMGKSVGTNITQTFLVASNGTFSVSDNHGNSFSVAPPSGLLAGLLSVSLSANSTVAVQQFVVAKSGITIANVSVTYSVNLDDCASVGLRITISGSVSWPGGSGTISIPFLTHPLQAPTKANGTSLPAQTQAVFGTKGGVELAFDWSDSLSLNPSYSSKTNSVSYTVGDSFTIDPTTIGTSTTATALRQDGDGQVCYANGRIWVFYFDGANFGWTSSTDGILWLNESTLTTAGVKRGGNIDFICNSQFANQVAYFTTSVTQAVSGSGTMNSDGTITWNSPEGTVIPTYTPYNYGISWAYASGGLSTFAIATKDSSSNFHIELWHWGGTTWVKQKDYTMSNGYLSLKVLHLSGSNLALVGAEDGNNAAPFFAWFDGNSWGNLYTNPSYVGWFYKGSCVDMPSGSTDVLRCLIPNESNGGDGPADLYSITYGATTWPSPTSLGTASEASLANDAPYGGAPGVTNVYASWKDNPSNTVYFSESVDGGNTWQPATTISTSETSTGTTSETMTTGDTIASTGLATSVWLQGTCTCNIRVFQTSFTLPPSAIPPWGESGISPYGDYLGGANTEVSMGSGLLSIAEPTLTLAGRDLAVSPTLFYEEPGVFKSAGTSPYEYDNFTLSNLGYGWSLDLPYLGTYEVHLQDGQAFPYAWSGTDMQIHGPVDFDLASTSNNGVCPCYLTLTSGVKFTFDVNRKLTAETDPVGNTITFSYGTNGYLSSIIDTVGRSVTFGYNAANQLTSINAPTSRTSWTLAYSSSFLSSITDPLSRVTSFGQYTPWLINSVTLPGAQSAKATMTFGTAAIPGQGTSYVVTSRNIYPTSSGISSAATLGYVFALGQLTDTTVLQYDGSNNLQGQQFYQFGSGVQKLIVESASNTIFHWIESDFSGNRLIASKIFDRNNVEDSEADYSYDDWGNVIYLKQTDFSDPSHAYQAWFSYANTNSYNSFGSSGCSTTGFYNNNIASSIHDRIVGSCDFAGGTNNWQQEDFKVYDGLGEMTRDVVTHNGDSVSTSTGYDSFGNVLQVTDPNGHTTYYRYSSTYGSAYLTKSSVIAGGQNITQKWTYQFSTGFELTSTDPEGNVSTYVHDSLGRLTTKTYPSVNGFVYVTTWIYDDVNNVVTISDNVFDRVVENFDGIGRETSVQVYDSGTGLVYSTTYYTYNWMDKVATMQTPMGRTYTRAYDYLGRTTLQTNPDGTKRAASFDDTTNQVTTVDESGRKTVSTYGWSGRLNSVKQWTDSTHTATTTYSYDEVGNLASVQDPIGNVYSYAHDDLNRLTGATYPDSTQTTYSYDSAGNMITKQEANGGLIAYFYDEANRLITAYYPNLSSTTYAYDKDSNLRSVSSSLSSPSGTTTEAYNYDAMNRMTKETTIVAGTNYVTQFGYDHVGRLTSITYPDTSIVSMTYDGESRLSAITGYATFAYNVDNLLTSVTFNDGEVQSYSYDTRDRVTQVTDAKGGTTYLSLPYTYDKASNILSIGGDAYTYDNMSRVATFDPSTSYYQAYSYDGAGNVLTLTDNTGTVTGYKGCGYYTNTATVNTWVTCTTDSDGNVLSTTGGRTYTYDYEDQMLTSALNGITKQTNVYDGLGNRVEKTETDSTIFTYLGISLLFEKDINTGVVTKHIYGDGMQIAEVIGGATYYLHSDQVGSVRLITYQSGSNIFTAFSASYKPFGSFETSSGSSEFTYAGQMYDSSTVLSYMGARYYNMNILRFMSRDPLPGSLNPYAYAEDNPLSLTDPTGMMAGGWQVMSPNGPSSSSANPLLGAAVILTVVSIAQGGLDPITDGLAAADWGVLLGTGAAMGASIVGPTIILATSDASSVNPQIIAAAIGGLPNIESQLYGLGLSDLESRPLILDQLLEADSTKGRTDIVQGQLQKIYAGETEVSVRVGQGMGIRRVDVLATEAHELKFAGDPVMESELNKDMALEAVGGTIVHSGQAVDSMGVQVDFVADPIRGTHYSASDLSKLDAIEMTYKIWGPGFWWY